MHDNTTKHLGDDNDNNDNNQFENIKLIKSPYAAIPWTFQDELFWILST